MNNRHLSKFLSLVLRHRPEKIGITLDDHGWADLELLLQNMLEKGMQVSLEQIEEVVRQNDKQRFKLDLANNRIRANQGHSVAVDLLLQAQTPPETLFHGTADHNLPSIQKQGLIPGNRQHVHLSPDPATAIKVGSRHGRPLVLEIRTAEMQQAGFQFFLSENGVWLTASVPPEYLKAL